MNRLFSGAVLLGAVASGLAAQPAASFPVAITVDAGRPIGEMKPIWRFFGADEPNYATMKDGKKLLGELGGLRPQEVYFARTTSSTPATAAPR